MPYSQYKELAVFYDSLMTDVPYQLWAQYLQSIFRRYNSTPETILDVACGTGNVSKALADLGYKVTGIDLSADMIQIAKSKNLPDIAFHNQGIAQLNLSSRFQAAVSLFDSINYVTDPSELALGMQKVYEHLEDNALFVFDVNTIYALENHFFDRACLSDNYNPKFVWTSEFNYADSICTVSMTFEATLNGEKVVFKEVHKQRGYSIDELSSIVVGAGFELLDVFKAYKFSKPTKRSDRVFFIGRKTVK